MVGNSGTKIMAKWRVATCKRDWKTTMKCQHGANRRWQLPELEAQHRITCRDRINTNEQTIPLIFRCIVDTLELPYIQRFKKHHHKKTLSAFQSFIRVWIYSQIRKSLILLGFTKSTSQHTAIVLLFIQGFFFLMAGKTLDKNILFLIEDIWSIYSYTITRFESFGSVI